MKIVVDRRQVISTLAAGAVAMGTARAQSPPPKTALIPRRLLFDDPDKTSVQISPDGRRIAYLAPLNGVLNVWVAPIGNVADARPLTRLTDRRVGSFFWLHNNRYICFVREQGGADTPEQPNREPQVLGEDREDQIAPGDPPAGGRPECPVFGIPLGERARGHGGQGTETTLRGH